MFEALMLLAKAKAPNTIKAMSRKNVRFLMVLKNIKVDMPIMETSLMELDNILSSDCCLIKPQQGQFYSYRI